jgi:hypothetical protein
MGAPRNAVTPRVYTIEQVEVILARSESSLRRDIKAGILEAVYIGHSLRITVESVDRVCTPSRKLTAAE